MQWHVMKDWHDWLLLGSMGTLFNYMQAGLSMAALMPDFYTLLYQQNWCVCTCVCPPLKQ